MANISVENVKRIGAILKDNKRPLKERFRALFSLKNINNLHAINCIVGAFDDPSALLKHEMAYCLGQMKDPSSIHPLQSLLNDKNQEPIVRHEAAEALGAIADPLVENTLRKFTEDETQEVAETCQLALERLEWLKDGNNHKGNKYQSVDPAPALDDVSDIEDLKIIMMEESLSMFDRYRAMFTLRDIGSPESALALTIGLKTGSALFSHEIAFVLGQMKEGITVPALIDCLSDCSQNEMVRHECAEALGAIATEECFSILRKHLHDEKRVVRESCEIALDMCDYETSDEFQYAIV